MAVGLEQVEIGAVDARDRRQNRLPAIPLDWQRYINDLQQMALRSVESFGWSLFCIRRPELGEPTLVMAGPGVNSYAVLEQDGTLNVNHGLTIRA